MYVYIHVIYYVSQTNTYTIMTDHDQMDTNINREYNNHLWDLASTTTPIMHHIIYTYHSFTIIIIITNKSIMNRTAFVEIWWQAVSVTGRAPGTVKLSLVMTKQLWNYLRHHSLVFIQTINIIFIEYWNDQNIYWDRWNWMSFFQILNRYGKVRLRAVYCEKSNQL